MNILLFGATGMVGPGTRVNACLPRTSRGCRWWTEAPADSSEAGSSMWARARGRTENALQQLPFKAAYMLRPGIIQPLHGIRSRTGACRWLYRLSAPLLLLRRLLPGTVRTEALGHAMLAAARRSASRAVLETVDVSAPGHPA